ETVKRFLLAEVAARHRSSLRPLDDLPRLERATQVPRLAESGDRQVENRGQLRRAKWLEKVGHHAGQARPIDELLACVAGEEHNGTTTLDQLPGHLDAVAVREPDGADGNVRARATHQCGRVRAAHGLADYLAARRPDRGAK